MSDRLVVGFLRSPPCAARRALGGAPTPTHVRTLCWRAHWLSHEARLFPWQSRRAPVVMPVVQVPVQWAATAVRSAGGSRWR
jgi:hypothetical protein